MEIVLTLAAGVTSLIACYKTMNWAEQNTRINPAIYRLFALSGALFVALFVCRIYGLAAAIAFLFSSGMVMSLSSIRDKDTA